MSDDPQHTLLLRCDAGPRIGTGHVMRCLALAQAWQDRGGRAVFAAADVTPGVEARIRQEGADVLHVREQRGSSTDAERTARIAQQVGATWIVADGYVFGPAFQQRVHDEGLALMVVDDNGEIGRYQAELVLNQNVHADQTMYRQREASTRLLLGSRYALLRRDFLRWCSWQRDIPELARRVVVTLGGGDADNVAQKAVEALQQVAVDRLDVRLIVGPANPYAEQLRAACVSSGGAVRVEQNVHDMAEVLAWADVAVMAGGSTCWEAAFMGLPALLLVLADNQRGIAERLDKVGVALSLGWHAHTTARGVASELHHLLSAGDQRAQMSRRGRRLVDGRGSRRILAAMDGLDEEEIESPNANLVPGQ